MYLFLANFFEFKQSVLMHKKSVQRAFTVRTRMVRKLAYLLCHSCCWVSVHDNFPVCPALPLCPVYFALPCSLPCSPPCLLLCPDPSALPCLSCLALPALPALPYLLSATLPTSHGWYPTTSCVISSCCLGRPALIGSFKRQKGWQVPNRHLCVCACVCRIILEGIMLTARSLRMCWAQTCGMLLRFVCLTENL